MMDRLQSHNLLLDDNRTKESLKLENDAYVRIRNSKTRTEVVSGAGDVKNHLGKA